MAPPQRLPLLWHRRIPFWKRGVSNRRTLERVLSNQSRYCCKNSCCDSCPPKPTKPECHIPDPSKCEPPEEKPSGRSQNQKELMPCVPECRSGMPNLPPRGCLPWEKGVELCPGRDPAKKLETECCEHLCEPYVGQGIIDKLKMSTCEYRRFKKCYEKTRDAKKCLGLGPSHIPAKKEYPMLHAVNKKYLPGCPITSHRFVKPTTLDQNCE